MPNKTICFFNSSKSWGGGEKWHFDIATKLHEKAYKVIAITNKESELYFKLSDRNIKTYPIEISNLSFLNPFKVKKIAQILHKEKITTIIINLPADLKVAAPAAKKAKVAKIIYRRGSAIPIKNKLLNRILFRKYVDEVIANSFATKNTILANNPELFDKNKIKIIYNGINIDKKAEKINCNIYLRKNNELIIGNAGRFVKQKNHKFLIELALKLKELNLNFKLLLAGDGKLKSEIIDYAKQLNIEDNIVFTGFVENIKSFMSCIDIYILPSLWEGFGYVLVEAMFCQKPVVAFNLSSNPEIIEDKKTGFLVGENNLEETINKIKLLANNKKLREEQGENGKKRVLEYFTIDKTLEHVENILV